jgi:hypothetical protein
LTEPYELISHYVGRHIDYSSGGGKNMMMASNTRLEHGRGIVLYPSSLGFLEVYLQFDF